MTNFMFRPAVRENVGLLIGLAGGTGSGKTYSALRLATGIAGGKKFGAIDTEGRRMLHYASDFDFDHGDLGPPFRPERYVEAIEAADKAGYPVIVVDSFSHEWAGNGGVLDWQEEEFQKMGGQEKNKMRSWIKPKMGHKSMVQHLLQVRAHLILCFRAEEKIEMKRNASGKMEVVVKEGPTGLNGWFPVSEKSLPYEMTASFLLMADKPGIPNPIKLQEQHKPLFPAGKHIDEEMGKRIAEWASGGESEPSLAAAATDTPAEPNGEKVNAAQMKRLGEFAKEFKLDAAGMRTLCSSTVGREVSGAPDIRTDEYTKLVMSFDKVKAGDAELRRDPPRFEFPPQ